MACVVASDAGTLAELADAVDDVRMVTIDVEELQSALSCHEFIATAKRIAQVVTSYSSGLKGANIRVALHAAAW